MSSEKIRSIRVLTQIAKEMKLIQNNEEQHLGVHSKKQKKQIKFFHPGEKERGLNK